MIMKNKLFFAGLMIAALMFASCDPLDPNDPKSYCWEISYDLTGGDKVVDYVWATGAEMKDEIIPGYLVDEVIPVYKKVESAKDEDACDALYNNEPNEELVCLKVVWPDHTYYAWVTMEGWEEDLASLEPGDVRPLSWERSSETDYDACAAHNREACIKVTEPTHSYYKWVNLESWQKELTEMAATGVPAPSWELSDEEDPSACEGRNQPIIN